MKVPPSVIPFSVVVIAAMALLSTRLFSIPTLTVDFEQPDGPPVTEGAETVTMTVAGVACKDKARLAADALSETPGILRFVAYASYNRVEITFLPDRVSVHEIRELLEGPVFVEETGNFLFNQFSVLDIDGEKVGKSKTTAQGE
jgi:hypothetical protein